MTVGLGAKLTGRHDGGLLDTLGSLASRAVKDSLGTLARLLDMT